MSKPPDIEAIRKRNHDLWYCLNGHGVMCRITSLDSGDLAFKQCAQDIGALLDEVDYLDQLVHPEYCTDTCVCTARKS